MLLKFAGIKKYYAIGMRWALDERKGIEAIQLSTGLDYGIMLNIREKLNYKLRLVALADDTHKNSWCLSGLLAAQYKNLILVHRISNTTYWVCVIKNHTVWAGVDVPKATSGDFVHGFSAVSDVIEAAKAEFSADGIDLREIQFCSETASADFPDFQSVDLFDFISKLKKDRKYFIRYLEPSKILLQKIILLVLVVAGALYALYYVHEQRLVTRILHQQQLEAERQRQLEIQRRHDYFEGIQLDLRDKAGSAVIHNVMLILKQIPPQSAGWDLVSASYSSQSPKGMTLTLKRSEYGTLNSFLNAYSASPSDGVIDSNNNTGTKVLTLNNITLDKNRDNIAESELTSKITHQTYRLISYMQLNASTFDFKLKEKVKSRYDVTSSKFTVAGDKLWKLVQLEMLFRQFSTVMISNIKFTVSAYDMSWIIEGEIYA